MPYNKFTMEIKKCEGIVLHQLKYGEYDQILTVFTREEGLIKLIYKGASGRSKNRADLLMRGEFLYTPGKSSLMTCREFAIINPYLSLRKSLACLEGACAMAKALLDSQCEQKPAPQLYDLFICYLERLPLALQPEALPTSFLLKVLRHEGLLGLTPHCSVCLQDLTEHHVFRGESYCRQDKPAQAITLNPFEAETLFVLAFSRSFALIEQNSVKKDLQSSIIQMFAELNQH